MKKIYFPALLALICCGCLSNGKSSKESDAPADTSSIHQMDTIRFDKLEKLFIVGDFDGDGRKDSLFQYNFSKTQGKEIDSFPSLSEWADLQIWFEAEQESDIYLAFHKPGKDTLHLGSGFGLYCLINLGDLNADGKDEIALVVDRVDWSAVNLCKIYTLCKEKWTLLKEFYIYENSFFIEPDTRLPFTEIKNFLEKRKGKWYYFDYVSGSDNWDSPEKIGTMDLLKLEKCK